ncbi:MAG: HAD family hydrolase [Lachnospiraceae bacterium]|nr:HAD family hydrolase [Lachnospiraceae bacterium]
MNDLYNEPVPKLIKMANRLLKSPEDYSEALKEGEGEGLKLAVLGSYSIQHLTKVLRLFLDREGVFSEIYEGEYDGIKMDVLDPFSKLYEFNPRFVVILMRHNDFRWESEEDLKEAESFVDSLFSHLSTIKGVTVFISNIALPPERPWGTLEADYIHTRRSLITRFNLDLAKNRPGNARIIDFEYLSSLKGKEKWFDDTAYYLSKQGFSMDQLGTVAGEITRMILPDLGRVRKCLVLDLDNTLWGGIVGEDGPEGINVDPNDPEGEAYRAFQEYVLLLKKRGVLLAVNSKNDEDTAKEPFEKNPGMILKLSDIACFTANWSDKAGNMAYIAKHLNIGMDSLVFFDDSPAEREIIRRFCPEVLIIDVPPDPEDYITALDREDPFEWTGVTREDIIRSDSYIANAKREEMASSFTDYREYLKALEMKGRVVRVSEAEAERFAMLTNKSNQFNLRTQRYSDGEIRKMMDDENIRLLAVSLEDKFTGYGIISCIVLRKGAGMPGCKDSDCFIENWCMSCRVLKRGVENLSFKHIREEAEKMGCSRLVGEFIRTRKNGMVEGLYASLGFSPLETEEPGEGVFYEYDLSKGGDADILITEETDR